MFGRTERHSPEPAPPRRLVQALAMCLAIYPAFGLPSDHTILGDPYTVGNAALLAYLATLVWTGIAIVATSRIASPRHRPGAVSETR